MKRNISINYEYTYFNIILIDNYINLKSDGLGTENIKKM